MNWRLMVEIFKHSEGHWWARYTGADACYYWLHPISHKWIGEPDQIGMPMFKSWAEAKAAVDATEGDPPGVAK